ncbi:MAG TPA: diguanylate cyclase, partial [Methylophilus sp.]
CRNLMFKAQIPHEKSEVSQLMTISIGVSSIIPGSKDALLAFVDHVDGLMYQAKKAGRNRIAHQPAPLPR